MLTLRLFGGLSLESSAGPVPAGARQRRRLSLLALLALAGERGSSRERVQVHLWPESTSDRARHALDQLLYSTRRDLGPDAVLSGASDLRLNPAVVRVDVWAFDAAIRDGRWEAAAELHAGPVLDGVHLGDGVELERWIEAERARREQDVRQALESLARAAAARGDADGAVRWWRRRAAADPLATPVALELMRALAAAGDRASAVHHARTHAQLVRSTLDVEPDASVEALARQIAAAACAGPETATVPAAQPVPVAGAPAAPAPPAEAERASAPDAADAPRWRAHAGTLVGGRVAARIAARVAIVAVLAGAAGWTLAGRRAGKPPLAARAPAGVTAAAAWTRTSDPEARALYLRARSAWERRSQAGLEESVVLYRLATERDPAYAAAYAGLAQSYAMLGYFGFGPADAMFPKARGAALRALAIDSASGEAYAALGQALAWQHAWGDAERAYRRALALAPQDATVHQWYALLLAYVGRAAEAARHTGHASRLDPLSVQINNMHGVMLYYAGDLDAAVRQYERTVDAEPDSAWVRQNPWVLSNFGVVAAAAGRHAQAVRLIERAARAVPGHPRPLLDLAAVHAQAGEPARARAAFARADRAHPHYTVYRALLHAQLGELDEAFAWFARVREWPLPTLVGLSNSPRYEALRADPRFRAVRARLRLPAV